MSILKSYNQQSIPLLLTGTIDSSVYMNTGNKICDIGVRLEQYTSAITRYIKCSPFTHIVFIENSGYDFDAEYFINLANEYGKHFEYLSGKICKDEIIKRGKSFGDAFLIHEALEKSDLLKHFDFFYKITGRIYLENAQKIIKTMNKYKNEFIVYTGYGMCLTYFFKADKQTYLNILDDVYNDCDETTVNDIEMAFYKRLVDSKLKFDSFDTYPVFDGVMGATLRNYSGKFIERFIRNIMARFHCFALNSKMSFVIKIGMKILGDKGYL